MKYFVLFNPLSKNGTGEAEARKLNTLLPDSTLIFHNIIDICDYSDFVKLQFVR